jgi:translation initiation factor 2 subunit 3
MVPPAGCTNVDITVAGAAKYRFTTYAPADDGAIASKYLEDAAAAARSAWKNSTDESSTAHSAVWTTQPTAPCNQPSLSIGLIGDVANGKSTLVKAMTGVKTQRHSTEQRQHGITIRLGFANAAIIRCTDQDMCGAHAFASDDHGVQIPACIHCGEAMEIVRRVSFVDCPGHAELMATMLAGSSAFDAVILAAAANAPCPSPQASQHLAALSHAQALASDGKVAIAQTKAELLEAEDLEKHAAAARENLTGTIAAAAPIFPTCAPLGIGIAGLARWLAAVPARDAHLSPRVSLNVLRSFDVNAPGTGVAQLQGGVVGGTLVGGGKICIGDELEVRPGLILSQKSGVYQVLPLRTKCAAVMSGTRSLDFASSGGLIALQTTLCPSFCADDRLAGAVVGPPAALPPCWGPRLLLDRVSLIELPSEDAATVHTPILTKGDSLRLHSGSATVRAKIVRNSNRQSKMEVALEAPLCGMAGGSVAIEHKSKGTMFRLVGHAQIFDGARCDIVESTATMDDVRVLDKNSSQLCITSDSPTPKACPMI